VSYCSLVRSYVPLVKLTNSLKLKFMSFSFTFLFANLISLAIFNSFCSCSGSCCEGFSPSSSLASCAGSGSSCLGSGSGAGSRVFGLSARTASHLDSFNSNGLDLYFPFSCSYNCAIASIK